MNYHQNKHVHDIELATSFAQASVEILIFLSEGINEFDRKNLHLHTITMLHSVAVRLADIESALNAMAKPDLRTVS